MSLFDKMLYKNYVVIYDGASGLMAKAVDGRFGIKVQLVWNYP